MTARPAAPHSRLRTEISAPTVILLVAAPVLTVVGMVLAIPDARGGSLWGWMGIAAPVLVSAYATIELCWRRSDHLIGAIGFRTIVLSGLAAVLCATAAALTYATPSFQQAVVPFALRDGWHYWFDAENGNPGLLIFLAGWFLGGCAGLVALITVVLPFYAAVRPAELADANAMDLSPRHVGRNRVAGIALSMLLIAVVAVAVAFVLGWILAGIVLVVVAVVLTLIVLLTQRVDRSRRRALGVSPGLQLPDDDDG